VARTTLGRDLVEMIKVGSATKERILRELEAASSGAEALRRGPPAVTVRFADIRKTDKGLAVGTAMAEEPEPIYDLMLEASLYALSDPGRADVIRFGRSDDQDVILQDDRVSREHGLIILADSLLYCDYGTLIDGVHAGSRNGTYVRSRNRESRRIRNTMITWLANQTLLLGRGYYDPAGNRWPSIQVTYEVMRGDDTN
jgi:hypothetical protein